VLSITTDFVFIISKDKQFPGYHFLKKCVWKHATKLRGVNSINEDLRSMVNKIIADFK
jgi:hypothetical protein